MEEQGFLLYPLFLKLLKDLPHSLDDQKMEIAFIDDDTIQIYRMSIKEKVLVACSKNLSSLQFFLIKLCFTFVLDLEGFDSVVSSTEKLSHPTTSRPKATGRRPPSQSLTSVSVSSLFLLESRSA